MFKKISLIFICLMSIHSVASARVNNSSKTCFLRLKACSYQFIHNSSKISDKDMEYAQAGCDKFMDECQRFIPGVCTTLQSGNYICDTKESVETMFIQQAKTDKALKERLRIALDLDPDKNEKLQDNLDYNSDLNPKNLKDPFKDGFNDYSPKKEEKPKKNDNVRIINIGF